MFADGLLYHLAGYLHEVASFDWAFRHAAMMTRTGGITRVSRFQTDPLPNFQLAAQTSRTSYSNSWFSTVHCDIQPCPYLQIGRSWPKRTHCVEPYHAPFKSIVL